MIQIKVRRTCYDCEREGQRQDCPECNGTGWVEFWTDLEQLAKSIRAKEPLEPMVNLLHQFGDQLDPSGG